MNCIKCILFVIVVLSFSDAVKVNMQGTVNLGRHVIETLQYYLKKNYMSGRRAGSTYSLFKNNNDPTYLIIKSNKLCRGLQFCERKLEKFLNEFIMILAKLIDGIFVGIMTGDTKTNDEPQQKIIIFEEELRTCLTVVKKILREVSYKITEDKEAYLWTGIIKKISALFQETAIAFVTRRLEGKPADVEQVKKKLNQKIIIATSMVEEKYESKLCTDYKICSKSFECTKALNTLLQTFKDMDEAKVKSFIRFVYASLPDTFFFSILSEMTVNEFQVILNDMAYSNTVPTKEVLLTIQRTVQDRLDSITAKRHAMKGRDVELLHVILSDMDYFYSKTKADAFHTFLSQYFDWVRNRGKLGLHIRKLMKEINEQISEASPDIVAKFTNEVRVFLEMTVDPETTTTPF